MKIEEIKISQLIPYANNAKIHDEKAINAVAESIKQFGFVQPVVIDKNNEIVIGHCRVLASKKLNLETVPCVCVDELTEEQVKALRLADNKTNELSDWDFNILNNELENIIDIDMSEFGFDINMDVEKSEERNSKEIQLKEEYNIVIECEDEEETEKIYNEMTERGYKCRVSVL